MVTNTTSMLRNLNNGAEVFLVGTAHISKASADEVRDVMRAVRPDVVMVELDAGRAERLKRGQTTQEFIQGLMSQIARPGMDPKGLMFQLGVGGMYQAFRAFGFEPGAEFKVALEEAERMGAKVVYGDQHIQRTLARISAGLDFSQFMRLMGSSPAEGLDLGEGLGGLESQVESLKTRAAARMMTERLRAVAPGLAQALIDDRDQHMADVLLKQHGRVVAVVGLAHLDGIERRWEAAQKAGGAATVLQVPPSQAAAAGR